MSGSQGAGSAAAADVRLSVPGVEESKVEQPVVSLCGGTHFMVLSSLRCLCVCVCACVPPWLLLCVSVFVHVW